MVLKTSNNIPEYADEMFDSYPEDDRCDICRRKSVKSLRYDKLSRIWICGNCEYNSIWK